MSLFTRKRIVYSSVFSASCLWLFFFFHLRSLSAFDQSFTLLCAGNDPKHSRFTLFASSAKLSSAYLPFKATQPPHQPRTLQPVQSLPQDCLQQFITSGTPCFNTSSHPPQFDVLWTWVNGSDSLHADAYIEYSESFSPVGSRPGTRMPAQPKLYREHDELRHSMRSVLQNFRPYLNRFHLLTADFPLPQFNVTNSSTCDRLELDSYRLGQIPQFLDLDQQAWKDGDVPLSVSHHAQFFSVYNGTIFNSFAIESQISQLSDLSQNFVYMNDDYFFLSKLQPFDFWTPTYGLVLRFQSDSLVRPASKVRVPSKGEWLALEHSNQILSERFGFRSRPYVVHEAKSGSTPLMREMALTFPSTLSQTGQNRFRATPAYAIRDAHPLFMLGHFVVERSREAMLWTWIVARIGGPADEWTQTETDKAWAELGGEPFGSQLVVVSKYRKSLDPKYMDDVLRPLTRGKTTYDFSSLDGYPYTAMDRNGIKNWPNFTTLNDITNDPSGHITAARHPGLRCTIEVSECFPHRDSPARASEVFKTMAFDKPQCGDCVISALVVASGELGLSAFLPDEGETFPPAAAGSVKTVLSEQDVPHLPVTPNWKFADFSLRSVLYEWTKDTGSSVKFPWSTQTSRHVDLREFTTRLLHRYRYIIGNTPSKFVSITNPPQTRNLLARISTQGDVSLLCVNDDITSREPEVDRIFRAWQDRVWPERATWEL